MSLVFIPISSAECDSLSEGIALGSREAYTVLPELCDSIQDGDDIEVAEHAVMLLASIAGLINFGERIVLVAEIAEKMIMPGADPANGQVNISGCARDQVKAFFIDNAETDIEVQAKAVKGLDLNKAWELNEVQKLLQDSDLLWHGQEELC